MIKFELLSSHNVPLRPCRGQVLGFLQLLLWLAVVLPLLWEIKRLVVGWASGQTTPAILGKWLLAWLVSLLLAAFFLARLPVKAFIQAVYAVPQGQGGAPLRSMNLPLYPLLTVGEGGSVVSVVGDEVTLSHIGGPALISVYHDTAVVLEQGGRFTRVLCGPTLVTLARFERLYQVVDLRPQHGAATVKAMSKEGIPITCHVEIEFQIAWGDDPPTEERPYPASPEAVFRAAVSTQARHMADHTVRDRDWVGRVVEGSIGGTLRALLAQKPLDQLVPARIASPVRESLPEDEEPGVYYRELQDELVRRLSSQLLSMGVTLRWLHLGNIDVDEVVAAQWADIWRAGWRKWAMEVLGEGRAERLQYLDQIRAETQVEFLKAVAHEIRQLDNAGMPISDSLIALQFIDALRQMEQPLMKQDKLKFPGQMWNALEQLRRIIVRRDDDPEIRLLT